MSSSKRGVAKRIADLEPRHCYGHALNLAAGDTLKQCKLMKDSLETTREITKLIKYSPRRDFSEAKGDPTHGTHTRHQSALSNKMDSARSRLTASSQIMKFLKGLGTKQSK